jgi:hypothetical protein
MRCSRAAAILLLLSQFIAASTFRASGSRPTPQKPPRATRSIVLPLRSTAPSRAMAPTRGCGAQTRSGHKDRCRSAWPQRSMSAAATGSMPSKIALWVAPIWRCSTADTEIGPTRSPPIIGGSAISNPGSRRVGPPMDPCRASRPIWTASCTTAACARASQRRQRARGGPHRPTAPLSGRGRKSSGDLPNLSTVATKRFYTRLDNAMALAVRNARLQ